jgi:hypothetical protein
VTPIEFEKDLVKCPILFDHNNFPFAELIFRLLIMNFKIFISWIPFICISLIFASNIHANENKILSNLQKQEKVKTAPNLVLNDITQKIIFHKKEVNEKKVLLEKTKNKKEKEKIQTTIDNLEEIIANHETSFEIILTGGTEFEIDETIAKKSFDWEQDLIEILQPFLRELHKLTENKRRFDDLHFKITFHQNQIQKINDALKHISQIEKEGLQNETLLEFERINQKWLTQLNESKHLFEVAKLQRDEMLHIKAEQQTSLFDYIQDLSESRWVTLLLALSAFIGVYLLMLMILKLFTWMANRKNKKRNYFQRVISVLYYILIFILALTAFFYVLEVRDEPVMTGITIVLLICLIWVLKNSLPAYIEELRLLLNTGSAREGECIIYNGVTMQIQNLQYYTNLSNPLLPDLKLRLTLSELKKYVSRPVSKDEPWFPCKEGDYVMLYGDIFGKVKNITLESIVLSLPDGIMPITYTIEDFLIANPRNFSQGFVAQTVFAIDPRNFKISTTLIPQILTEEISLKIKKEIFGNSLINLSVEFKNAESSLLYEIIATFEGDAADKFYYIVRVLQRYAVEVCNEKEWIFIEE